MKPHSSILHSISVSLGFPLGVLLVIVGEKKPTPSENEGKEK